MSIEAFANTLRLKKKETYEFLKEYYYCHTKPSKRVFVVRLIGVLGYDDARAWVLELEKEEADEAVLEEIRDTLRKIEIAWIYNLGIELVQRKKALEDNDYNRLLEDFKQPASSRGIIMSIRDEVIKLIKYARYNYPKKLGKFWESVRTQYEPEPMVTINKLKRDLQIEWDQFQQKFDMLLEYLEVDCDWDNLNNYPEHFLKTILSAFRIHYSWERNFTLRLSLKEGIVEAVDLGNYYSILDAPRELDSISPVNKFEQMVNIKGQYYNLCFEVQAAGKNVIYIYQKMFLLGKVEFERKDNEVYVQEIIFVATYKGVDLPQVLTAPLIILLLRYLFINCKVELRNIYFKDVLNLPSNYLLAVTLRELGFRSVVDYRELIVFLKDSQTGVNFKYEGLYRPPYIDITIPGGGSIRMLLKGLSSEAVEKSPYACLRFTVVRNKLIEQRRKNAGTNWEKWVLIEAILEKNAILGGDYVLDERRECWLSGLLEGMTGIVSNIAEYKHSQQDLAHKSLLDMPARFDSLRRQGRVTTTAIGRIVVNFITSILPAGVYIYLYTFPNEKLKFKHGFLEFVAEQSTEVISSYIDNPRPPLDGDEKHYYFRSIALYNASGESSEAGNRIKAELETKAAKFGVTGCAYWLILHRKIRGLYIADREKFLRLIPHLEGFEYMQGVPLAVDSRDEKIYGVGNFNDMLLLRGNKVVTEKGEGEEVILCHRALINAIQAWVRPPSVLIYEKGDITVIKTIIQILDMAKYETERVILSQRNQQLLNAVKQLQSEKKHLILRLEQGEAFQGKGQITNPHSQKDEKSSPLKSGEKKPYHRRHYYIGRECVERGVGCVSSAMPDLSDYFDEAGQIYNQLIPRIKKGTKKGTDTFSSSLRSAGAILNSGDSAVSLVEVVLKILVVCEHGQERSRMVASHIVEWLKRIRRKFSNIEGFSGRMYLAEEVKQAMPRIKRIIQFDEADEQNSHSSPIGPMVFRGRIENVDAVSIPLFGIELQDKSSRGILDISGKEWLGGGRFYERLKVDNRGELIELEPFCFSGETKTRPNFGQRQSVFLEWTELMDKIEEWNEYIKAQEVKYPQLRESNEQNFVVVKMVEYMGEGYFRLCIIVDKFVKFKNSDNIEWLILEQVKFDTFVFYLERIFTNNMVWRKATYLQKDYRDRKYGRELQDVHDKNFTESGYGGCEIVSESVSYITARWMLSRYNADISPKAVSFKGRWLGLLVNLDVIEWKKLISLAKENDRMLTPLVILRCIEMRKNKEGKQTLNNLAYLLLKFEEYGVLTVEMEKIKKVVVRLGLDDVKKDKYKFGIGEPYFTMEQVRENVNAVKAKIKNLCSERGISLDQFSIDYDENSMVDQNDAFGYAMDLFHSACISYTEVGVEVYGLPLVGTIPASFKEISQVDKSDAPKMDTEKAADFNRQSSPIKVDGGSKPLSNMADIKHLKWLSQTVGGQSPLMRLTGEDIFIVFFLLWVNCRKLGSVNWGWLFKSAASLVKHKEDCCASPINNCIVTSSSARSCDERLPFFSVEWLYYNKQIKAVAGLMPEGGFDRITRKATVAFYKDIEASVITALLNQVKERNGIARDVLVSIYEELGIKPAVVNKRSNYLGGKNRDRDWWIAGLQSFMRSFNGYVVVNEGTDEWKPEVDRIYSRLEEVKGSSASLKRIGVNDNRRLMAVISLCSFGIFDLSGALQVAQWLGIPTVTRKIFCDCGCFSKDDYLPSDNCVFIGEDNIDSITYAVKKLQKITGMSLISSPVLGNNFQSKGVGSILFSSLAVKDSEKERGKQGRFCRDGRLAANGFGCVSSSLTGKWLWQGVKAIVFRKQIMRSQNWIDAVRGFIKTYPNENILGALIYGSVARYRATKHSDLDYCIIKEKGDTPLMLADEDEQFHNQLIISLKDVPISQPNMPVILNSTVAGGLEIFVATMLVTHLIPGVKAINWRIRPFGIPLKIKNKKWHHPKVPSMPEYIIVGRDSQMEIFIHQRIEEAKEFVLKSNSSSPVEDYKGQRSESRRQNMESRFLCCLSSVICHLTSVTIASPVRLGDRFDITSSTNGLTGTVLGVQNQPNKFPLATLRRHISNEKRCFLPSGEREYVNYLFVAEKHFIALLSRVQEINPDFRTQLFKKESFGLDDIRFLNLELNMGVFIPNGVAACLEWQGNGMCYSFAGTIRKETKKIIPYFGAEIIFYDVQRWCANIDDMLFSKYFYPYVFVDDYGCEADGEKFYRGRMNGKLGSLSLANLFIWAIAPMTLHKSSFTRFSSAVTPRGIACNPPNSLQGLGISCLRKLLKFLSLKLAMQNYGNVFVAQKYFRNLFVKSNITSDKYRDYFSFQERYLDRCQIVEGVNIQQQMARMIILVYAQTRRILEWLAELNAMNAHKTAKTAFDFANALYECDFISEDKMILRIKGVSSPLDLQRKMRHEGRGTNLAVSLFLRLSSFFFCFSAIGFRTISIFYGPLTMDYGLFKSAGSPVKYYNFRGLFFNKTINFFKERFRHFNSFFSVFFSESYFFFIISIQACLSHQGKYFRGIYAGFVLAFREFMNKNINTFMCSGVLSLREKKCFSGVINRVVSTGNNISIFSILKENFGYAYFILRQANSQFYVFFYAILFVHKVIPSSWICSNRGDQLWKNVSVTMIGLISTIYFAMGWWVSIAICWAIFFPFFVTTISKSISDAAVAVFLAFEPNRIIFLSLCGGNSLSRQSLYSVIACISLFLSPLALFIKFRLSSEEIITDIKDIVNTVLQKSTGVSFSTNDFSIASPVSPSHILNVVQLSRYFINSLGVIMRGLNPLIDSKSSSPVTIKSALASKAASNILSSSPSRQRDIFLEGFTNSAFVSIALNNRSTSIREISPMSLVSSTSLISLRIKLDKIRINFCFSNDSQINLQLLPPNKEEIKMLVSITTFSFFFIEFSSYSFTYLCNFLERYLIFCLGANDRNYIVEPVGEEFILEFFKEFNPFFNGEFGYSFFEFPRINFQRNFIHNLLLFPNFTIIIYYCQGNENSGTHVPGAQYLISPKYSSPVLGKAVKSTANIFSVSQKNKGSSPVNRIGWQGPVQLGGSGKNARLCPVFDGSKEKGDWISAGNYDYKVWIEGELVKFQQYINRTSAIGSVQEISIGAVFMIGKEVGDYQVSSDTMLGSPHFCIKVSIAPIEYLVEGNYFNLLVYDIGFEKQGQTPFYLRGRRESVLLPLRYRLT